jgi:predicted regulator of amino acid metabolism with ACT domain
MQTEWQMWEAILNEFVDSPSQGRVARFLLENGFGVSPRGKVTCNGIELPATHIARATGTDRRVVDATAQHILSRSILRDVFSSLRVTPDLSMVAEKLGLVVVTILPNNAQEKGIIGAAVEVLTDNDLAIRQIFVTDPYFAEDPRLVIIIDGAVPPKVYEELRNLPQVRQLVI